MTTNRWAVSSFNFIVPVSDEKHVAYNAFSGALAELDAKQLATFKDILQDPEEYLQRADADTSLFASIVTAGFIHDAAVNELDLIKTKSALNRFNTEQFHLTIMPTLACNFECPYCYEKQEPILMSDSTEDALVSWVQKRAEVARIFTVAWFGGEPLLALDRIESTSNRFRAICERRGINYCASLTTNGYLLNDHVCDRLAELGIVGVQVTIDGPRHIHDVRRYLRGRGPTFDRIVKNVEHLVITRPEIAVWIRVNCDESNIDEVGQIFDQLPSLLVQRTDIYFAFVYSCQSFLGNAEDVDAASTCDPHGSADLEFRKKLRALQLESVRRRRAVNPSPVTKFVFRPRWAYCEADYANKFVVDPRGDLHKCTVSFSPELRVGRLLPNGDALFDLPKLSIWLSKDAFSSPKCTSCKVLPLCLGGCRSATLQNISEGRCATLLTPEEVERSLGSLYELVKCSSGGSV